MLAHCAVYKIDLHHHMVYFLPIKTNEQTKESKYIHRFLIFLMIFYVRGMILKF